MTSIPFQKNAGTTAVRFVPLSLSGRLLPRRKPLRLRRKIPSWTGLVLLVLAADVVLAALAWGAVYLVLS
jgi:hypothetical protein